MKPLSSRPASSERYIVGLGLLHRRPPVSCRLVAPCCALLQLAAAWLLLVASRCGLLRPVASCCSFWLLLVAALVAPCCALLRLVAPRCASLRRIVICGLGLRADGRHWAAFTTLATCCCLLLLTAAYCCLLLLIAAYDADSTLVRSNTFPSSRRSGGRRCTLRH